MILVSIILFCLVVVFGIWLVVLGVRHRRGSFALAASHVSAALLGLGLLSWQISEGPSLKLYNFSALLFFFALFGGMVLMILRIGKREFRSVQPMFIVGLHAVVGVIALMLLVMGFLKY